MKPARRSFLGLLLAAPLAAREALRRRRGAVDLDALANPAGMRRTPASGITVRIVDSWSIGTATFIADGPVRAGEMAALNADGTVARALIDLR